MMERGFDADFFYAGLDAVRCSRNLTWAQVAKQAGVSESTLSRMPEKKPGTDNLVRLSMWSGVPIHFGDKGRPLDIKSEVFGLLRKDPSLSQKSAAALNKIFCAGYDALRDEDQ